MCFSVHRQSKVRLSTRPNMTTSVLYMLIWFLIVSRWVDGDQIYQPAQSEIDRFKMIQEQINLQQQQDQQQQKALDESMMARRHPFLSHLINHLMVKHQQNQHQQAPAEVPISVLHESQLAQPVSQLVVAPSASNQQPVESQIPITQQIAQMQSQHLQQNAPSLLQSPPNINPDSFRLLMHKNLAFPGENPADLESKLTDGSGHDNLNTKTDSDTLDFSEPYRDDKNRHKHHHQEALHGPRRCYACSWSIAQCSDFNCYNNPDICTNNHFKSHRVHQADCPSGCEQMVITDPNGLITSWKRGCAPPSLPIKGYRCNTHYELGIRIDRCICNHDWCNWAHSVHHVSLQLLIFSIISSLFLSRLLH